MNEHVEVDAPADIRPSGAIIRRAECPDCASSLLFSYDGIDAADGLHSWSVTVAHHATCPQMRRREAQGYRAD